MCTNNGSSNSAASSDDNDDDDAVEERDYDAEVEAEIIEILEGDLKA